MGAPDASITDSFTLAMTPFILYFSALSTVALDTSAIECERTTEAGCENKEDCVAEGYTGTAGLGNAECIGDIASGGKCTCDKADCARSGDCAGIGRCRDLCLPKTLESRLCHGERTTSGTCTILPCHGKRGLTTCERRGWTY